MRIICLARHGSTGPNSSVQEDRYQFKASLDNTETPTVFCFLTKERVSTCVCLSLSVISEPSSQLSSKPLTCGGGSGIVQNTKALILKSEHVRMENEISKLKQQNEQLIKQKSQLLR